MKKQLFILLLCFSLISPGSSFITGLNAQTKGKRTARTALNQKKSQKGSSALKISSIQKILQARKAGNEVVGDPCQTLVPITLGQTINADFATGDCQLDDETFIDFYSFNGTAGQPISVNEDSNVVDTFLFLFDDQGNVIDSNDDSGTGTSSRVPADAGAIILPYTGQYVIGANTLAPEAGAYSVTLNSEAASCVATPITYNQTVNGTLAESDCAVGGAFFSDLYTFHGTAGDQISISQDSPDFDSFLTLDGPDGAIFDDDGGTPPNSRIPETSGTITLTATGTYTIEASAFDAFSTGNYTLVLTGPNVAPSSNKLFDYDGDGKADVSVFRPSESTWYIQNSGTPDSYRIQTFGISSDTIVPADYDGDGKTDIAVFRPSEGNWYSYNSATNTTSIVHFGAAGDVAVPADFDGDDKADLAIFRPSDGSWWISQSSNGVFAVVNFGTSTDKPVLADFDGDGKTDIAVFRPSEGNWYILQSSNAQVAIYTFGVSTDIPTPADFDGDGKADVAIFRPTDGSWWISRTSDSTIAVVNFGTTGDKPIAADYDGDGKADVAVFRPSSNTWFLLQTTSGFGAQVFGLAGDSPTPNAFIR